MRLCILIIHSLPLTWCDILSVSTPIPLPLLPEVVMQNDIAFTLMSWPNDTETRLQAPELPTLSILLLVGPTKTYLGPLLEAQKAVQHYVLKDVEAPNERQQAAFVAIPTREPGETLPVLPAKLLLLLRTMPLLSAILLWLKALLQHVSKTFAE